MKTKLSCLLVGLCLLTGCWQKSIHPFYQTADVQFDAKLLGAWQETPDDPARKAKAPVWTFVKNADQSYKLSIVDGDGQRDYIARLFELGGMRLLDLLPPERGISTVPAHNLARVVVAKGAIEIALLNTDWVQKWLRNNPTALTTIAVADPDAPDNRERDELVITAETKAVQRFLLRHQHEKELFTDADILKRVETSEKKN
ncbi:MAG: hypothetical protein HYR88_17180 [Verrucomicrobia bacterium]|nr:hypothetical protein [Verrucomicrobiota bacterium]MBI3867224.1 hypothetical protein [Verrucomicrobiota bacterium]